ncbi:hypothetical protein [Desulfovibrio inopinatus]|uniref:hypothetical protein n=1 Tax=Desulfovibrio inopinatus TaxID=102109 RepID=UPI0003F51DB6|nr:hypothetical protein [Desulfovibrio inopinatus]
MRFETPFLPDPDFTSFLVDIKDHLSAVHFRLYVPGLADARSASDGFDGKTLVEQLRRLDGVPQYGLLNARFHHPDIYTNTTYLDRIADHVQRLKDDAGLVGLVATDFYLLKALARHQPDLVTGVRLTPSVNCAITTVQELVSYVETATRYGFARPVRYVVDRRLNRQPQKLDELARQVDSIYPGMALVLLANEGCLADCPYRLTHEAQIALASFPGAPDPMVTVARRLGCLEDISNTPGLILSSPFIRPEDVQHLPASVAELKLCGRTRGPNRLRQIIQAYLDGAWKGNLFELLDAPEALARTHFIENAALPEEYYSTTTQCSKLCSSCGYCDALAKALLVRLPPDLSQWDG